jgi:hypothetical protein
MANPQLGVAAFQMKFCLLAASPSVRNQIDDRKIAPENPLHFKIENIKYIRSPYGSA